MKQDCAEMNMSLLEKSPEAGHLLVQLHDQHRLYQLAKNSDPVARAELATIMTDILEIDLSVAGQEIITDVLMGLIRQAETDLRQALAERISTLEKAPLRMVLHLANDEISIADPILRRSRVLTDMDLIYIIKAKGAEYWQAIACRPQMNDPLIDALAETHDFDTAVNLSENKNIELTESAMTHLSSIAETSERIARPLVMRDEISQDIAERLYNFVGRELKEYIHQNFEGVSAEVDLAVNNVVQELTSEHAHDNIPSMSMILAAETMMEQSNLSPDIMLENLRRGQVANFVAQFSVYCGLPIDVVSTMLSQKTAQGLAVACKAVSIQKAEFVNMFLLTSRLRGGKIIDHNDLSRALSYYDKIKQSVAQKILKQSRH